MTAQPSELEGLVEAVFQGPMRPPAGARIEGLALEVADGGRVVVKAGTVFLPPGSTFLGQHFPRGGAATFEDGQATLKHSTL